MSRLTIYTSITVFSIIGAYIPVLLFGADMFDLSSIVGGILGSFAGLYIGFKLYQNMDS